MLVQLIMLNFSFKKKKKSIFRKQMSNSWLFLTCFPSQESHMAWTDAKSSSNLGFIESSLQSYLLALVRAAILCASSASTSGRVSAFLIVCCSFCSASSRSSWRCLAFSSHCGMMQNGSNVYQEPEMLRIIPNYARALYSNAYIPTRNKGKTCMLVFITHAFDSDF